MAAGEAAVMAVVTEAAGAVAATADGEAAMVDSVSSFCQFCCSISDKDTTL